MATPSPIPNPCTKDSVTAEVLTLLLPSPALPFQALETQKITTHSCQPRCPIIPFTFTETPVNLGETPHVLFLKLTNTHTDVYAYIPYIKCIFLTLSAPNEVKLQKLFTISYDFFAACKIGLVSMKVYELDPKLLELYFWSVEDAWKADRALEGYCRYFTNGEMVRWEDPLVGGRVVVGGVLGVKSWRIVKGGMGAGWREVEVGGWFARLRELNELACGCNYAVRKIECWVVDGREKVALGAVNVWRITFSDWYAAESMVNCGMDFFGYWAEVVELWSEGWEKKMALEEAGRRVDANTVKSVLKMRSDPDLNVNRFSALELEEY